MPPLHPPVRNSVRCAAARSASSQSALWEIRNLRGKFIATMSRASSQRTSGWHFGGRSTQRRKRSMGEWILRVCALLPCFTAPCFAAPCFAAPCFAAPTLLLRTLCTMLLHHLCIALLFYYYIYTTCTCIYIFFLSIYVLLLYNTILSINTLITASLHHLCVRILIYNIYICMCIYIYMLLLYNISYC